mgnify:FL=1
MSSPSTGLDGGTGEPLGKPFRKEEPAKAIRLALEPA